MSYTAPTSWTSHGINWTADPFNLPLNLSVIESLRIALNERRMKTTVIPLAANVVHGQPDIGTFGSTNDFALRFHWHRDKIIGGYVDHHDEANWHGSDDEPKAWTKADLFTYIGETEIVPALGSPLDGAWVRQQYLILNQLRWTRKSDFGPNPWHDDGDSGDSRGEVLDPSYESTRAAAQATAEADYANIGSGGFPVGYSYEQWYASTPNKYEAGLRARRGGFYVSIEKAFECDVDFYFFPDKPVIAGVDPADVEPDSFGQFTHYAKWNLLGTTNSPKGTPGTVQQLNSPLIGTESRPSWPSATSLSLGVPIARGWSLFSGASLRAVAKWDQDATNGFQFID